MKVEKQSNTFSQKHELPQPEHDQLQYRKSLIWTREKINQLIDLYKKHECLWNHWDESYKSKDKRSRAIHDICTTLRITKFEFGKKIHNLRNQFNTEMKKLEKRGEEAGVSIDEASTSELRCRWIHFESLMFLRYVIEPRPTGYQTSFKAPKKLCLKFDTEEDIVNVTTIVANNNTSGSANTTHQENLSRFQYDDNTTEELITDELQSFENDVKVTHQTSREEVYDQKYQPPRSTNENLTTVRSRSFVSTANNIKARKPSSTCSSSSSQTEIINMNDDAPIIELNSSNLTVVPSHSHITTSSSSITTPVITSITSGSSSNRPTSLLRDQWDAFGELVANEFRNLNSELSQKRLKRKIMQAMLEIGEEEDSLISNRTRNN